MKIVRFVLLTLSMLSVSVPAFAMIFPGTTGHIHIINMQSDGACLGMSSFPGGVILKHGDCVVRATCITDWNGLACSGECTVTEVISGDDCWEIDFEGNWKRQ